MNDKLLSFLGLCRRAGKMTIGCDAVKGSIIKGETKIVIFANDVSKKTEKEVMYVIAEYNTKVLKLDRTKDEVADAIGKYAAVISINDSGFAKKIKQLEEKSVLNKEECNL